MKKNQEFSRVTLLVFAVLLGSPRATAQSREFISQTLERAVDIVALEEALGGEHVDLVMEDTDSPSNLAATGQNDVLVRLRPEKDGRNPNQTARLWVWAASDNLRLHAQNAVECALDLRRLRPAGTVQ